jgi:hypothetical protein
LASGPPQPRHGHKVLWVLTLGGAVGVVCSDFQKAQNRGYNSPPRPMGAVAARALIAALASSAASGVCSCGRKSPFTTCRMRRMTERDQEQGNVIFAESFAATPRSVTTELRALDRHLKARPFPDGTALREFRQALDNARLAAWTVNELVNAHEIQRDPRAVISFLTAERLRRFGLMVNDFCSDLDHDGLRWPAHGIQRLQESLNLLRERLGQLD